MTNIMKKCKERLANARKNDKGFTLVELIVVIVILAILIGVTVGGVSTYIGQSRENTDINNASSITSVLGTLAADEDIYKAAKTETKTYTFQWVDATKFADISGAWNIGATGKTCDIKGKVATLLSDGLPESKTGNGFKLEVKLDGTGNIVIKCTAGTNTTSYAAADWN